MPPRQTVVLLGDATGGLTPIICTFSGVTLDATQHPGHKGKLLTPRTGATSAVVEIATVTPSAQAGEAQMNAPRTGMLFSG